MSPTAAIDRAVDAFNDHDLDAYMPLYAEDVKLHGYPPPVTDWSSLRAFYATFLSAFPDLTLSVHETVADGDVLALRFSLTGTHNGDFMGMAATGQRTDVGAMTFMHFSEEDQVIERWNQLDDIALLTQLGVMPGAPA